MIRFILFLVSAIFISLSILIFVYIDKIIDKSKYPWFFTLLILFGIALLFIGLGLGYYIIFDVNKIIDNQNNIKSNIKLLFASIIFFIFFLKLIGVDFNNYFNSDNNTGLSNMFSLSISYGLIVCSLLYMIGFRDWLSLISLYIGIIFTMSGIYNFKYDFPTRQINTISIVLGVLCITIFGIGLSLYLNLDIL